MPRIIEFQGRRIQVPDAATDEQIAEILQSSPAPSTPTLTQRIENVIGGPSPMADPAAVDTPEMRDASGGLTLEDVIMGLGGVVDQGVRGVTEGVTNIVGLPQAVATLQRNVGKWGMEQMGAPEAAVNVLDYITPLADIAPSAEGMQGGIDAANNATADALGVERPRAAPENFPERYANRVGEELGAMLIPGAVVANRMKNAGRGIAAINPGAFWSKEATVATGAGTGAAIANEVAPDSPIADLFGALAGAGTVAVGGPLVRSVADVGSAIFQRDNFVDQVVKDAVVDRVGKAANLPGADTPEAIFDTKTLVDAIDDPARRRPSDLIPGYQETLSDRTGNAGIASLEYGRAAGVNAGQYNSLRMNNNEAVDAAMRGIEPQATPGTFREAVSAQRDQQLLDLIMGQEMAARQADTAAERIRPINPNPEARGAAIRTGVEGAEDAARTAERRAWEGIQGPVDPAPLAQTFERVTSQLPEAYRQATSDIQALTAIPGGADGAFDMRDVTAIRSRLTQAKRAAESGPQPDSNKARIIGQYVDALDDYLEEAAPSELYKQITDARAVSRDVNERFNRPGDPLANTLARREGRPIVPDSGVGGQFLRPDRGQASNVDRVLAETDLTSGGQDVFANLQDEARANMERYGVTTKPERAERYGQEFGRSTDRLGLRDDLNAVEQTGRELQTATTNRQTFEKIYGTPGNERGTGTVGKYLQFGDEQSERAISQVLSSKDPAKAADELVNFVGNNPRALEGARSAFWQKLKTESQSTDNAQRSMSGKRQWRGDWLKSWLDDPSTAAVAERLYKDKPEDLEKLRAYADVLDNADLRVRGKASGTSGTSQGVSNIMTPETIQSRTYAWMRGQISGTYLATSMAAVFARRAVRGARADAIERLTDKVLLNPELAKELLKDNNPANRAALARKAKGWLGNQAATTLEILNEDDSEDEDVKRTIMREKN